VSLPDIFKLKQSINIADVIGRYVDLKRHGSNLFACCPFHDEKTPSFSVNTADDFYYCFGCGSGGDVVNFVQNYNKCSFQDAVKILVGEDAFADITAEQAAEIQKRRAESEKKRKADQFKRWHDAEKQALKIWNAAETIPPAGHDYLYRKHVTGHGLRVGAWPVYDGEQVQYITGALLVPVSVGKKIVSLQAIFQDSNNLTNRDKTFLPGGKMAGGYFIIGEIDGADTFIICEGYATGASIYDAVRLPVFVAFNAGNLAAVAERVRKAKPVAVIIIAADNDRFKEHNAGVTFATDAAKKFGCLVAVPEFDDGDSGTDYNDLAASAGLERVADSILAVIPGDQAVDLASDNPVAIQNNAVQIYAQLIDLKRNGSPLATIANLAEICRRLDVVIRYDVIKKDEQIIIPGADGRFSVDNEAAGSVAWLKSECAKFYFPTERINDFVTYLADKNLFNPVATWITSKPWDGVHRLPALLDSVQSFGTQTAKNKIMTRWLISCVAAAFLPNGVSAHGCLVFQGSQGLGKTYWFKSLVPDELGVIKDGLILRPDDKDSVKQIISNWLVELGELDATFKRSDIAQLKSFLTRDRDTIRRPYSARESCYARRTVFFASVNPKEYLHDPTGNRRFWTVDCKAINYKHGIDMQQLWREVYDTLFLAGEQWYLTPDEMEYLADKNRDFEVVDPIDEQIKTKFNWEADATLWTYKTATDILLSIGFTNPTMGESTRAAHIVRTLNDNQGKRSHSGRVLLVPPLKFQRFTNNEQF